MQQDSERVGQHGGGADARDGPAGEKRWLRETIRDALWIAGVERVTSTLRFRVTSFGAGLRERERAVPGMDGVDCAAW
ncbi:hypothetical protein FH608_049680 [Nonomuraea phyllanthi]|uniref:Uncharacterized protein n=1 Tax=Nonomuraea phyllanthi TaxID=2219224 RepID=A0A8E0T6Y5_9ACTN|nr:hypothetical protein [Nonomuraea phyllanthi]KAB8182993.1 hypothetical protein FH608_049680 [Nonomuraea phyllanthi]